MSFGKKRTICRSAGEVRVERTTINKDFSGDDTDILPLRKNVQAGRLSRAGCSHQSRDRTRLHIAHDIVQQAQMSTWNGDDIIDILPCKHPTVREVLLYAIVSHVI